MVRRKKEETTFCRKKYDDFFGSLSIFLCTAKILFRVARAQEFLFFHLN